MAAGFEVRGDGGYLQIDGFYSNLTLVQSGLANCDTWYTGVSPGNPQPTDWYYTWFTVRTYGSPLFAIYDASDRTFVFSDGVVDGQTEYGIVRKGPGQVRWALFDRQDAGTGNYGLQVFNSAGDVVFDASNPYARVLQGVAGSWTPGTNLNNSWSFPGKKIAIVQGSLPQSLITLPTYSWNYVLGTMRASESTFTLSTEAVVYYGGAPNMTNPRVWPDYNYLVLDITNIL